MQTYQKSYCAALERRETILLTLLDRQVELKQDMIEEARTEVAAARARILAAKEEGQYIHTPETWKLLFTFACFSYSGSTSQAQPSDRTPLA